MLKSAAQIFQRTYGVTRVTGEPRVIKYPPEKYYSVPGVPNEWMGEQALNEIRKLLGYNETRKEDLFIVPDTITARQAGPQKQLFISSICKERGGALTR